MGCPRRPPPAWLTAAILLMVTAASPARAQTLAIGGDDELDPNRYEIGAVPAVGYSSDEGIGFAFAGSLAKFAPDFDPYRWHLDLLGYVAIREAPGGGVEAPNVNVQILLDLPGALGADSRLQLRGKFSRYRQGGYHGFGNASRRDLARLDEAPRYYAYEHVTPHVEAFGRRLIGRAAGAEQELFGGLLFGYHDLQTFAGSKLEADLAGESGAEVQGWLVGTDPYFALNGTVGLLWDSRDHELAPQRGTFSEISLRGGTGLDQPFTFGAFNLTSRLYLSLWGEYLVLASRLLVELMFGEVPLAELPRAGGLSNFNCTGGPMSIRGVVPQRLLGRIKLLGNLELRSKLLPFTLIDQRFNLGTVLFVDTGRVWADYAPRPDLDGIDLGLAVGVGGGLRLQWGEAFMLRVDGAYSPTDDTPGFYLNVYHIF